MAYIYKISNDFDNKIYIGKTTRDVQLRFEEHFKKTSGSNSYIDNDMADKGIEHFTYEILEECSIDNINEKEKFWISYYHSYIKDPLCKGGYNLTPGGEGRSLSDQQSNQIRELWEQGLTAAEIGRQLDIPQSTVYHRINQYEDFDIKENKIKANQWCWKPVSQYTINGKHIQDYDSISQATKALKISHTGEISQAIKYHTICHGYRWAYKDEELIIKTNKKQVAQIDIKTNKIINIYDGVREAGRQTGFDYTGIIKTCNGKQKTCKGYLWRYINE